MKHTQWRDNYKRIVPNRAMAYSKSGTSYQTNMPNEFVYGNGGLLTTAEDLLIWNNYYLNGKLGNPSLLEKQLATTALNSGVMHRYAAGLFVGTAMGWKYVSHDGATAGYRANLEGYPELGLSIAWLSNSSEFDSDTLNVAEAVADLFLTDKSVKEDAGQLPIHKVEKNILESYVGWYRNSRTGGGVKLSMQNDKLSATQVGQLNPIADDMFTVGNNRVVFNSKGFLFINSAKDSIYFTRASTVLIEKIMTQYAGEYYSEEAEAKIYVTRKGDKVYLLQKPKTELILTPTYADGFESPIGIVYFEKENDKITGLKISVGRARNVAFKKIK
jgi:hypothetical protein